MAIWRETPDLDRLNALQKNTISEVLDIRFATLLKVPLYYLRELHKNHFQLYLVQDFHLLIYLRFAYIYFKDFKKRKLRNHNTRLRSTASSYG